MPDSQYNVNILIKSTDQSSAPAKQAAKGMVDLQKAAQAAALAYGALKTAQKLVDFVEFGAQADRSATALDNLAKAAGTSGNAIVGAMREASGYTIDSLTAMQVANRALVMGVAQTPAEFEKLTETAVTLGRAMGMTATASIDKFILAMGRQSRLIADDFGIIMDSSIAYEKYAQSIGVAADSLNLEQQRLAFSREMMLQATVAVDNLGGVTMDTAGKFEQIKALASEAKTNVAKFAMESVEQIGFLGVTLDDVVQGLQLINRLLGGPELPAAITNYNGYNAAAAGATSTLREFTEAQRAANGATLANLDLFTTVIANSSQVTTDTNRVSEADAKAANAARDRAAAIAFQNRLLWNAAQANAEYARLSEEAARINAEVAAEAARVLAAEMERLWAETSNATIAQQDLAAQLMDASAQQVATTMINMLSESLLAGAISQEAYRAAVESLQLQFGLATPETIKLAKAMNLLNTALAGGEIDADQLGAELAALDALKAQQAQVIANANATKAAAQAKRDATQASKDHEKALRDEQRALEAQERAARRAADAYWDLAQSLKDASMEQSPRLSRTSSTPSSKRAPSA